MKNLFIEKSVEIEASAGRVSKILTDPNISREWIRTWWPEFDVLESDWQPGSPVLWRLCNGQIGGEGMVVVSEPYWELIYNFSPKECDFRQSEVIAFKLREINDVTLLAITVGNFGDSAQHEACYSIAVDNWNKTLPKLKALAEERVRV